MTGEPTPAHELVARYLLRLSSATADLPGAQRDELIGDITAHLAEAVPPGSDELTARRVLDALGAPEQIAAAARAETEPARPGPAPTRTHDLIALLLLMLGGFVVPILGWVAGVVMLWNSPRWSDEDKWLGTLVWPGVIAVGIAALLAGGSIPLVIGPAGLAVLAWTFWRLFVRSRDALGGSAGAAA
ncbi:hypothetical protein WIS52_31415 [Pseudonocardia nematodicida]|uniref:DUF1700 domain-containing protein n=1 Tax=Pseudonocardia nematodicida TaxID=1206997 RepID=A0ABV1KKL4_9PSEU